MLAFQRCTGMKSTCATNATQRRISLASARNRTARTANRGSLICRASTEVSDEVDPTTGMPLPKYMSTNPQNGLKVNVKGVTWAYRSSEVPADKVDPNKPNVLLLHGLGSSSFSFRNTLGLMGAEGFQAFAPDWPGHGDSDKPSPSQFSYTEEGFKRGLSDFIDAVGVRSPVAVVVQGFVLSQYGLLWALENESRVSRLMILNTPLSTNSKLRPELAAYKSPIPFLRPKQFDGMMFAASGSAYVMNGAVAEAYARPFADPAASTAVAAVMDNLNFGELLKKVSAGYSSWKQPTVVLFGSSDPFLTVNSAFQFLDDKRTNMKVVNANAKLGHTPQEDYPEALHNSVLPWLYGETDEWVSGKMVKMTNKGPEEM